MFKPVSPRFNVTTLEEGVLRFWNHNHIFEKSSREHNGGPEYVFFEGPPTANGKPGVHHALARAVKDIFPRYKSMRGFHVLRRGGWDTHGLPVEVEVEKQLGLSSKSQIEAYGIEHFNDYCRKSVFKYIQEWEQFSDRLGFWIDLQDAYITHTNQYIESVWWILKSFWDKGLLYQGYRVVPYCPRCGTPLSAHELSLGYQKEVDPSVIVRMPLVEDPNTSLLVETGSPWTLPANVAVAANPELDYVIVERSLPEGGTEKLILALPLLKKVFRDEAVQVYETFKGKKLKGLHYQPLFKFLLPEKPAYSVIMEDFVHTKSGTGLVQIAPAFGAEDMQASIDHDLPTLQIIEDDGTFVPEVRPWRGKFFKDADPLIIQDLDNRGLLYRVEPGTHPSRYCWRCKTPLLNYARSTWFIRTSSLKDRMVELNQEINWIPGHIRDGRFGSWLSNNVDWTIGRERFWGTPLPLWECQSCHYQLAVGSLEELSRLSGKESMDVDLHRPSIDRIFLSCPECGGKMERVPEVIDVWFDSGCMPVAQWHYPFENQETFKSQFPADFICEAVDQTRGWFYALHAVSTLLLDKESFKNAICLGLVLDTQGHKMSHARGNVVDPWEILKTNGADALRWYLFTARPPDQERRLSSDLVSKVTRLFMLPLWNVYSFFVTNANLDGWSPAGAAPGETDAPIEYSALDIWLLSELNNLIFKVTSALESYDVTGATQPIQSFVEMLTNWYLRRSRKRFFKNGSSADKHAAYSTLYQALTTLSKLLAPTLPFLAEELYQNLVRSIDPNAAESVHLTLWPENDPSKVDEELNQGMHLIMKLSSLGHSARAQAGIHLRKPLSEAFFSVTSVNEARYLEGFASLLEDELNVKVVRLLGSNVERPAYTLVPRPERLGPKYKALWPAVRQAVQGLDPAAAAELLTLGKPAGIDLDGDSVDLHPDEVEVRLQAPPGLISASEGAYLCAINPRLTPELINEGLARDFIRRVQSARKQADFGFTDRIYVYVEASPGLATAIQTHLQHIKNETLALSIDLSAPPEFAKNSQAAFDGETAAFGVLKAV